MSDPTFRCDSNGDLWFNDWNRGNDDFTRAQMVRQSAWHLKCAKECRQALNDFDAFWSANEDEQLRYETETGS